MRFTKSQQAAVEAWGGDVCVIAGPGSGKTTVLVERLRWLVGEKLVDPSRVLAITFTEKAATEMLGRLTRDAGSDVAERLHRIEVATIHAFCARLLREHALDAGVDPDFSILEAFESRAHLAAALDQALEEAYEANHAAALGVLRAVAESDLRSGLARAVESRLAALADEGATLPSALAEFRALGGFVREIVGVLDAPEYLAKAAGFETLEGPVSEEHFRMLDQILVDLKPLNPGQKRASKHHFKRFRDAEIPRVRSLLVSEYFAEERGWLADVVAAAMDGFAERKRRLGALDYQDLERLAVAYLRSPGAVSLGLDHILVDEYQDVNPLQAALIALLRAQIGDPAGGVFGVGDLNQAIYGFRKADPTVFARFREEVRAGGGQVVELAENFRSRGEVLAFVDAFTRGVGGIEPRALVAGREFAEKNAPSAEVLLTYAEDSDDRQTAEAEAVAARIVALRDSLRIGDTPQPPDWGSFAILARTHAVGEAFARVLRRRGIPVETSAGRGLLAEPAVADCQHVLRALANPADDHSLAAVLLSPIGGCTAECLTRLRLSPAGEPRSIAQALAAGIDDAASAAFHERWTRYRTLAAVERPDLLLDRVLADARYRGWWRERPGGPAAVANIEKFLRLLRGWAIDRALTLEEIVARLEQMHAMGELGEQAYQPQARRDAVAILTAHGAKGLEFPVVFVVSAQAQARADGDLLGYGAGAGLGASWNVPPAGERHADFAMHSLRATEREARRDESGRLLYVALTRAQEHLVVSASFGPSIRVTEWAKFIDTRLGVELKTREPGTETANAGRARFRVERTSGLGPRLVASPAPAPAPERRLRLIEPAGGGSGESSEVAATAIVQFAKCPRRYWLQRTLGSEDKRATPTDGRGEGGAALGSEVHDALAGITAEPGEEAAALVAAFEASAIGKRVANSARVERELELLAPIGGRLVRCRIDLWFEDAEGSTLVDYKTDAVEGDALEERAQGYAAQMQIYALALKAWRGQPPSAAILAFLRSGVDWEVSLDIEALAATERLVDAFFEAQRSDEYPLAPAKGCTGCPFWRGACPGVGA